MVWHRFLGVCGIVAALGAGVGWGQGVTGTGLGGPGVNADDPVAMGALIRELGSESYAVRERAQKALLTVPVEQLETVRGYAERETDVEVKLRLMAGVKELEAIATTSVPGVSVDLKDATLGEVAAALEKASGMFVAVEGAGEERFTLAGKDFMFWEIIRRLSEQHPIAVRFGGGGLTLLPAEPTGVRYRMVVRGALFSTDGVTLGPMFPGARAGIPTQLRMNLTVALDPRLHVLQARQPVVTEMSDDHGHRIAPPVQERNAVEVSDAGGIWSSPVIVQLTERLEDRVTVRGHAEMLLPLEEKTKEVVNLAQHLNESTEFGGMVFSIKQMITSPPDEAGMRALGLKIEAFPKGVVERAPQRGEMTIVDGAVRVDDSLSGPKGDFSGWLHIQGVGSRGFEISGKGEMLLDGIDRMGLGNRPVSVSSGIISGRPGAENEVAPFPAKVWMELAVVDGEGREVTSVRLPQNAPTMTFRGTQARFKEPLKLVLRMPTRTAVVTVPFEIKDVPVKR